MHRVVFNVWADRADPRSMTLGYSSALDVLTVIVIGLVVENLIFRTIERNTVQKWGTQS
jgi:hypothetical protein